MMLTGKRNRPDRVNVICSHPTPENYPLGLGMVLAHAVQNLPASVYNLEPRFIASPNDLGKHLDSEALNVVLCCNHMWSIGFNLEFSRQAKAIDPDAVVIHGGPSTPSYPGAAETFLREHPEVTFGVCGEGELILTELLAWIQQDGADAPLPEGVYTLRNGVFIRSPQRRPVKDLNSLPSPYLTGIFDGLDPKVTTQFMVETNRGCPYQCAYCSWDDPMNKLSKKRLKLFSLDRILAELEWGVARGVEKLFISDGNFGILKRDVDIAEAIAEMNRRTGFPKLVSTNYAKNNHENLVRIVATLDKAKLLSHGGIVSIQTRDPRSLKAVNRSNIHPDVYDNLRDMFARMDLPLTIHLMLGMPDATPDAFMNDLRYYFDQPLEVTMFRTIMLPNSMMASPAYTEKYGLVADEHTLISATAAMPAEDMRHMINLGCMFDACHNMGVLRLPLLYLWWDLGIDPIRLLYELVTDPETPEKFPGLLDNLEGHETELEQHMFRSKKGRPRFPWDDFHARFSGWVKSRFTVPDSRVFEAVLNAQTALMPAEGRTYPLTVDLERDVAAWFVDHKNGRPQALTEYGPGRMTIRESCYFWRRWARRNLGGLLDEAA